MMRSGTRKEDAVSPVIATILLLIMTVTVITVAALVVTDIAGGYGDAKSVDIRVSPEGENTFSVVVTGGPDAADLTEITGQIKGGGRYRLRLKTRRWACRIH